jgi:hypothetical protein
VARMTVRERLLAIKLAEKLQKSDLATKINVEIKFVRKTDESEGEIN